MYLRTKATIATALFLLMVSSLLSVLSYDMERHSLIQESQRKIELALSMLAEMTSTPLSQGDVFSLALIADRAARGQTERVCFTDRNGLILADSRHTSYDLTNSVVLSALKGRKTVVIRSGGLWEASRPVIDESGRLTGAVYITFPTRPLDEALRRVAFTTATFAMISTLLGVVLAYLFGNYLNLAIRPTLAAIRRAASGNLESRIEPVGIREIDEVGQSFNSMSESINNRVHTLEALNKFALNISSIRTIEEFVESLQLLCIYMEGGRCRLLLGDPRTRMLRFVGGEPLVRKVTDACLALLVVRNRRAITIGKEAEHISGSQVAEGYNPESAVVAPLITPENEILGIISVDFDPAEVPSPRRDLAATVEAMSFFVAPMLAAIQRSQTQEQAIDALRDILLPESPSEPEGVEVFTAYEVSEKLSGFGGDYYDVLQLGDDKWAFAIGDVSGKGLSAGRYTAMAKYAVRSFLLEYHEPSEALTHANAALTAQMAEIMFLTMFLMVLHIDSHTLTYSCAGHPPVLLYSHKDGTITELSTPGMVMGLEHNVIYHQNTLKLEPADVLMLYTDGLIEARRDGEQYGIKRLRDIFIKNGEKPLDEAASAIVTDVEQFASGGLNDDLALLMLRIK